MFVVVIAMGALFSWWIAKRADSEMREILLTQAHLVSRAINIERIKALTGSEADLNSPQYVWLKEQLAAVRSVSPKYRFFYLMGRRNDGKVFYFVDNEPPTSKDCSPPGQVYDEASEELKRLFDTAEAFVEGPLTDRWGTYVSALVPLSDPERGVLAILGMDIEARDWRWSVASQAALPALLTMLTLFLGSSLFVLQQANQSIRARESALRASETQYRSLITEMNQGLAVHELIVDESGTPVDYRFIDVNESYERLTGLKRDAIIGKTVLEVLPRLEKKWIEKFGRVAQTGESLQYESYVPDLDRYYETVAYRPRPNQFAVIVTDITAHRQAEDEKEKLQSQLMQAQKMESIGRLAGGVAHDFNNMLQVITGSAALALEETLPSSTLHESLEEILRSAQHSADLTRRLLAFARKQTISPKVLDLNEVVSGMLKMLQRLIGKEIVLQWVPGPNLWPVRVDPGQIDQILANLTVNASDAIEGKGQITIKTGKATLDETYAQNHPDCAPDDYVTLEVIDTGHGMDAATRAHIFEPFFTTKEPGKGTGLGLATVYGIVKQNNGFIDVHSELGKGTTFTIFLPRFAGEASDTPTGTLPDCPHGNGEVVLLVEDEMAILNISMRMLKDLGYTVLAANTPDAALRLAREHCDTIKLLITDLMMPEMNGRDLANQLVSFCPSLGRLFMSGYTPDVIAHRGTNNNSVQFIQKPFSKKELAIKVREVLSHL